jgi:glycosyltransferase involved in cell wall biosynthesis
VTKPVLFLNPVGTLGGGERSLLDFLAVLREVRPDWPLHVIAGGDGPLCEEASRLGVTAEIVPMPAAAAAFGDSGLRWARGGPIGRWAGALLRASAAGIAMPPYLRSLAKRVAAIGPRLVHSNGMKCHLLAGFVTPRSTPIVWHVRDFLTTRPILSRALRLAHRPAVAIGNSEATTADIRRALPGVRAVAVYNGIDVDRFAPGAADPAELDCLAGMAPAAAGTVRIGLVATYARWKGQDVFLDAAARVDVSSGPPVRFYVIGGPVYQTSGSQFTEADLRERIVSLRLGERAGLVPFVRDLPPVYRALDVVVHASTRPEPFGRTIVEAMACGRAVLVAKDGGAAELFTDGVDAIGVVPGDASDLAAKIGHLVADPSRRESLGRNARATATARFSRRRMAESIVGIYEGLSEST